MGMMDRLKKFVNVSEEEYFGEVNEGQDVDGYAEEGYVPQAGPQARRSDVQPESSAAPKVVDIRSNTRPQVVFKKMDSLDGLTAVADILNEKRIVILNLETCPVDITRRIIDYLSGVAYANQGDIKRVAGRAYIITPYNVPLTGELLDQIESAGRGDARPGDLR